MIYGAVSPLSRPSGPHTRAAHRSTITTTRRRGFDATARHYDYYKCTCTTYTSIIYYSVCVCVIRVVRVSDTPFGRIPNIHMYICVIFYVYNFVRSSGNRIFIRLSVAVVVGCVYTRLRRRRGRFILERDTACCFRRRVP